jgi:hypothetical protein
MALGEALIFVGEGREGQNLRPARTPALQHMRVNKGKGRVLRQRDAAIPNSTPGDWRRRRHSARGSPLMPRPSRSMASARRAKSPPRPHASPPAYAGKQRKRPRPAPARCAALRAAIPNSTPGDWRRRRHSARGSPLMPRPSRSMAPTHRVLRRRGARRAKSPPRPHASPPAYAGKQRKRPRPLHAGRLAAAETFRAGLAAHAATKPIHGECGGYMGKISAPPARQPSSICG